MPPPHTQLRKLDQAIDDCTSAIKLDDTYIKAYLRRAQWYVAQFTSMWTPTSHRQGLCY